MQRQFSEDATRRIIRSVLRSERAKNPSNSQPRHRLPVETPVFPVRLTSRYATAGYYEFAELEWNYTSQAWQDKAEPTITVASIGMIREIHARRAIPLNQPVVFVSPSPWYRDQAGGWRWTFESPVKWIPVAITGNTALGSTNARWTYSGTEVQLDTSNSYAAVSGGLSLTGILNLSELNIIAKSGTTAWYVGGVQANSTTTSSAYPTGFAPRPVGGGGTSATHKRDVIVAVTEIWDSAGTATYVIERNLTHDGTCT
jgi:hypothetical protein